MIKTKISATDREQWVDPVPAIEVDAAGRMVFAREEEILAKIAVLEVDILMRIEAVWVRLRKIEIPSKFSRQPEPAKGEVTGDRVAWLLEHIQEQAGKDQYINALSWTAELTAELVRRFDAALKGDRP